jgi:hypothetical protein
MSALAPGETLVRLYFDENILTNDISIKLK